MNPPVGEMQLCRHLILVIYLVPGEGYASESAALPVFIRIYPREDAVITAGISRALAKLK
jgi:hypothetical protein